MMRLLYFPALLILIHAGCNQPTGNLPPFGNITHKTQATCGMSQLDYDHPDWARDRDMHSIGLEDPTGNTELRTDSKYYNTRVMEYTYQGCQYIVVGWPADYAWGTHKGGCTNPIHQHNTHQP